MTVILYPQSDVLQSITLKEVRDVFKEAVTCQRRALAVQIVGSAASDQPPLGTPVNQPDDRGGNGGGNGGNGSGNTAEGGAQTAHVLPLLIGESAESGRRYLESVEKFKSELYLFPVTRIVE